MTKLPILCGDRESASRPCYITECRYNLFATRDPRGRKSTVERDERVTCSLDVAEEGAHTLNEVGAIVGLTRERVRQIEVRALLKLRAAARRLDLDLSDIVPKGVHALDLSLSTGDDRRARVREWNRRWHAKKIKQAGNA